MVIILSAYRSRHIAKNWSGFVDAHQYIHLDADERVVYRRNKKF